MRLKERGWGIESLSWGWIETRAGRLRNAHPESFNHLPLGRESTHRHAYWLHKRGISRYSKQMGTLLTLYGKRTVINVSIKMQDKGKGGHCQGLRGFLHSRSGGHFVVYHECIP